MPALPRDLSLRIIAAAAAYIVISVLLLAVSLNVQLSGLALNQQTALGNALGAQLAEALKQPIIDQNAISMQVILDNLLNETESVARATVYSTSNRILAQSQRHITFDGQLTSFTNPINVDNTMLGQVRVELDKHLILGHYHTPIWVALALWLLPTAGFTFWLAQTALTYTRRIRVLNNSFSPGSRENGKYSELQILERALEPFTQPAAADEQDERPYSYSLLAVSIPNLPKWRAQLNAGSFDAMLGKIDALIDAHLRLFNGVRLQARHNTMLIQFDNDEGEHAIARAINCGNALLEMGKQLAAAEQLPFEMRIAAAYRKPGVLGGPWRTDLEREECSDRLIDILPLTSAWELVIDKTQLDSSDLKGCNVEEFAAASVWQFRAYDEEQQENFARQLAFLKAALDAQ